MPKPNTHFEFTVRIDMKYLEHAGSPDAVTIPLTRTEAKDRLREHIRDAVESWGGQCNPYDFIFPQNIEAVKVTVRKGT
jgi:hypothetical protein